MLEILANHNGDIKRLIEKGFALAVDNNFLVIRDIPYIDSSKQVQMGSIVTKLAYVDKVKVRQDNHQIFFAGSSPCNPDGSPILNLGDNVTQLGLSEACSDVVVQRIFSNKPSNGSFTDFYDKIDSYVTIISGAAMELHKANPYTFRKVDEENVESVFNFQDTLTSRAEIMDLSGKFKDDTIAIIGVGGTGSYILDFLTKTPVREIRIYDLDPYYVHNAFRSPGKLEESELGKSKADVYKARYENFRKGIKAESKYIDSSSREDLAGVTFAFVSVDKGSSRADIFEVLIDLGIPFIDVGMGLDRDNGSIDGLLRTTYYSVDNAQKVFDQELAPMTDTEDDLYKNNIQIGELNALNACLAVIKYKQVREFYFEDKPSYHYLFEIGDLSMVEE